jgi:hypothetical protein
MIRYSRMMMFLSHLLDMPETPFGEAARCLAGPFDRLVGLQLP